MNAPLLRFYDALIARHRATYRQMAFINGPRQVGGQTEEKSQSSARAGGLSRGALKTQPSAGGPARIIIPLFENLAEGFTVEAKIGQHGAAVEHSHLGDDAFGAADVFRKPVVCFRG